jgi:hypothetical protein
MTDNMVRTQVYLPKATYRTLMERAEKQGLTMATQIRAALDEYLQRTSEDDEGAILQPDDPFFKMIGIFDSGINDLGLNHDHYLYGTPKRNPATGQFLREARKTSIKSRSRRPTRRQKSKR